MCAGRRASGLRGETLPRFSLQGRRLSSSKVQLSKCKGGAVAPQVFQCAAPLDEKVTFFGGDDGCVFVSEDGGGSLTDSFKVGPGAGPVTALLADAPRGALLVGTRAGRLFLFSLDSGRVEVARAQVNLLEGTGGVFAPQIQALFFASPPSQKLQVDVEEEFLVGACTRGGDLLLLQLVKSELKLKEVLMKGHCQDELWGVCAHPAAPLFVSAGDDKTLRSWTVRPGPPRQLAVAPLGAAARVCRFSPDGGLVAVGFGGRVGRGASAGTGTIRLFLFDPSSGSFTLCQGGERKDARGAISDLKFAPDGRLLVAASHDTKVYIYNLTGSGGASALSLRGVFSKHNAAVLHVDVSQEGGLLQSTCGACELLFSDLSSGRQLAAGSELKDVLWSSWTLPFGWPVQGLWARDGKDRDLKGSDVNAVARSRSGHLLAVGDDRSRVTVYKYPCFQSSGGDALELRGHSSHVSGLDWIVGDEWLVSAGGADRALFLWTHSLSVSAPGPSPSSRPPLLQQDPLDEEDMDDLLAGGGPEGGGDESGAVRPWLGAIRAPSQPPPINKAAPLIDLSLAWVHGYTCAASAPLASGKSTFMRVSKNLFYSQGGDLLYPAGALGVKMTRPVSEGGRWTQTFFQGHDDDVLCGAIAPCRTVAATGQIASLGRRGRGAICLWEAGTGACRPLASLEAVHERGVASLAFSPCAKYLLSVGLDEGHTHCVWGDGGGRWTGPLLKVAEERGDKGALFFTLWLKGGDSPHFVSGGVSNFNVWKLQGSKLSKKAGRLPSPSPSAVLCGATFQGRLLLGTSSGEILSYEVTDDGRLDVCQSIGGAHKGAVMSITAGAEGFVTGGQDGFLKTWTGALQPLASLPLYPGGDPGGVISLDFAPVPPSGHALLLCGTDRGDIFELVCPEGGTGGVDLKGALIQVRGRGHHLGEVWGVAPHPLNPSLVATGGDDSTVRLWDVGAQEMRVSVKLAWPLRSVAWSPSGRLLAVGFFLQPSSSRLRPKKDSPPPHAVEIYSVSCPADGTAPTLELVSRGCSSRAWVADLKFLPDGSGLAVCSHDKHMYMYRFPVDEPAPELSRPSFNFNKHSSAVLAVDFCSDGKFFQSVSQAGELLFGSVDTGRHETSATRLADLNNDPSIPGDLGHWATQTCKLGWAVQGIFPAGAGLDLSDINSVDRHPQWKYLAAAEDSSRVRVYRAPVMEGAEGVQGRGHSSHVTGVRWTAAGDTLVSVGGNDKCLFVWTVKEI